ncbi:hypothetical protein WDW86_07690 [Bdellovibrionota bacterium FG-2]
MTTRTPSHASPLRPLWIAALATTGLTLLFQLLTLNAPGLSGDEGMYVLVLEEIHRILGGHLPALNPVIDYEGPTDFWILSGPYVLLTQIFKLEAQAWMIRIAPLLFNWGCFYVLFNEVKKWSERLALNTLILTALTPVVLVYSHIGYPQTLLLGVFSLLLSESLRTVRTLQSSGEPRLFRLAIICGLAMQVHATAPIGVLAVLMPMLPVIIRRLHPQRFIQAACLFLILSYPELRNYPPPVAGGGGDGGTIFLQIRSMVNIITGFQPFDFWLQNDWAPIFLQVIVFTSVLFILFSGLRRRIARKTPYDQTMCLLWLGQSLATLIVVILCLRGRSLHIHGNERYLLSLVPGWIVLQADGLTETMSRYNRLKKAIWGGLLGLFFGVQFMRFFTPLLVDLKAPDPYLQSARWLSKNCPPSRCVAYAENFWNYWPIRYFTGDQIALNFTDYNWKPVSKYSTQGKQLSGCWFGHSQNAYKGEFSERIEFPSKIWATRQVCYKGIKEVY